MEKTQSLSKRNNKRKLRNILLATLIPIGVVGVTLGTVLPLTLCSVTYDWFKLKVGDDLSGKYIKFDKDKSFTLSGKSLSHLSMIQFNNGMVYLGGGAQWGVYADSHSFMDFYSGSGWCTQANYYQFQPVQLLKKLLCSITNHLLISFYLISLLFITFNMVI